MFTEEFNKMVTDPTQLTTLPVGDIRLLTERYPWCQSAQILLAKKLHLSDSPLFEQQLKKAAIITFDREQLHHYIHSAVPEPVEAGLEHEPELPVMQVPETELSKVEEEKVEVLPEVHPVPEPEPIQQPEPIATDDTIEEQEAAEILQEMMESIPEIAHAEPEIVELTPETEEKIEAEHWLEEENQLENLENMVAHEVTSEPIEEKFMEETTLDDSLIFDLPGYDIERVLGPLAEEDKFTLPPIPENEEEATNTEVYTDTFAGWLMRLSGPGSSRIVEQKASNAPVRVYLRKQPSGKQDPDEHAADKLMNEQFAAELARKSIQADSGLVSETYARILVRQGKYNKAVEMYQKLSLLKPQKSDYFAALIDQLKKR